MGGSEEAWDGAHPKEVRLYAPIRLGFRLDLGAYLEGLHQPEHLERRIARIEADLNASLPMFRWFGPEPLIEGGAPTIGHSMGRAPSKRPAFFLSTDWRELDSLNDVAGDARARLSLGPLRLRITVQDFGVGVAELRADHLGLPPTSDGLAFSAALNELTSVATDWLAAFTGRLLHAMRPVLQLDAGLYRTAFEVDALRSPDPGAQPGTPIYWMHALTVMEARGRPLIDDDWKTRLRETGDFPLRGHPIDAVIRLRSGALASLPSRDMDVNLMIGWGCSFALIESRRSGRDLDQAAPTDFVIHLSQAFNAALFDLNREVIAETSRLLGNDEVVQDLRQLVERLDLLQEQMNLITSLLSEQRFCLPAGEQRVWDRSLEVWGTDKLVADLCESLALLRGVVERRRRERDERRARRITGAVTVITISSAAALLYDMIPHVLEAERPSRIVLAVQMVILSAFMAIAWTLVRDARRARKAAQRHG